MANKSRGTDIKVTYTNCQDSHIPSKVTQKPFATPFKPFRVYSVTMTNRPRHMTNHSWSQVSSWLTVQDPIRRSPKMAITEWQNSHLNPKRASPCLNRKARICKKYFQLCTFELLIVIFKPCTFQFSPTIKEFYKPTTTVLWLPFWYFQVKRERMWVWGCHKCSSL